jgi:peroxiredoxin
MVALDSPAPAFALPDLAGQLHRLEDYLGRIVLVCFWSAGCPWSERVDQEIAKWPAELASGAVLLRLAVNADETPDDVRRAAEIRFRGIVLLDSDRKTAGAYGAQTTPEFFLLDRKGRLRYHGAFDSGTFREPAPARRYAENALRALLAGGNPNPAETPAYGCAIVRWKI